MSGNKTSLTRKTAAQLGVLDDFFALYNTIIDIYDKYISSNEKYMWDGRIDDLSRADVRKALDTFMKENTWVFTDQCEWLHPNASGLKQFSVLNIRKTGICKIQMGYCTFSEFLERVQETVARIITKKRHLANSDYYLDKDAEHVDGHIRALSLRCAERAEEISSLYEEEAFTTELITFTNLSTIACNRDNHSVVPRRAVISARDGKKIAIPAHYCCTCGRFFVGVETWRLYKQEYIPEGVTVYSEAELVDSPDYNFWGRSELYRHGYSVKRDEMSEAERQNLLIYLVKNNEMSIFAIVRDLHRNIRAFRRIPRFADAVLKWESDMKFIMDYGDNAIALNEQ